MNIFDGLGLEATRYRDTMPLRPYRNGAPREKAGDDFKYSLSGFRIPEHIELEQLENKSLVFSPTIDQICYEYQDDPIRLCDNFTFISKLIKAVSDNELIKILADTEGLSWAHRKFSAISFDRSRPAVSLDTGINILMANARYSVLGHAEYDSPHKTMKIDDDIDSVSGRLEDIIIKHGIDGLIKIAFLVYGMRR